MEQTFNPKTAMLFAESFQKQMHEYIENALKENPNLAYQDMVTSYFLYKLGELHAINLNNLIE